MSLSKFVYNKSPYWVQHILLNAYALRLHRERYGAPFAEAFTELEETQWYNPEQIRDYQIRRLRALVNHAYHTVPFYRKRYDLHGVHPRDIKDLDDISRLPLLTREDIRSTKIDEFISSSYSKRKLVHGHTSGTTGSPLSFYWDKQTCVYNNAVDWRQKLWAGIKYGDAIALLLGRPIAPTNKTKPPFWQYDRIHNMLWMSSFHLSEKFIPYQFEKLKRFRPVAIEGYPSTVYILARYLKRIGQKFRVKAVFTSSETLLPEQRALIEEYFQAPVFDFFGMAERIVFAGQCAEAHEYHMSFEFAVNEIVDCDGQPVPLEKEGYLVGTSLLNYGMPFIRYITTDVTAMKSDQCLCGRHMLRFKGVATKDEDIIVTPEGKLIASSVLTHPFKPLDAIQESQILQDEIDLLRIKIVRREGYTERDSEHLIAELGDRVGPKMRIELDFVHEIPREKSGKLRWVISKVPLPF